MRAGSVSDVCEEGVAFPRIFCTSFQFDSHTRNTASSMIPTQTAAKPQLGFGGQGSGVWSESTLIEAIYVFLLARNVANQQTEKWPRRLDFGPPDAAAIIRLTSVGLSKTEHPPRLLAGVPAQGVMSKKHDRKSLTREGQSGYLGGWTDCPC